MILLQLVMWTITGGLLTRVLLVLVLLLLDAMLIGDNVLAIDGLVDSLFFLGWLLWS